MQQDYADGKTPIVIDTSFYRSNFNGQLSESLVETNFSPVKLFFQQISTGEELKM